MAGVAATPLGTDGSFIFTVSLAKGASTAAAALTGTITATAYIPVYGVSLSPSADYAFDTVVVGYEAPEPYVVTVLNPGDLPTGLLSIALSGDSAEAYLLSAATLNLTAGEEAQFTVAPLADLDAGDYRAIVTLSGANIDSVAFALSFTVEIDPDPDPDDSGNDAIQSSTAVLKVRSSGGSIHVSGLHPDEMLSVYNLQGGLLYAGKAAAAYQSIKVAGRGVYIVVAGRRTAKVVVNNEQ